MLIIRFWHGSPEVFGGKELKRKDLQEKFEALCQEREKELVDDPGKPNGYYRRSWTFPGTLEEWAKEWPEWFMYWPAGFHDKDSEATVYVTCYGWGMR